MIAVGASAGAKVRRSGFTRKEYSFRALPNLCPRVANASLGERIAFDLEGELEGLLDEVGSALVRVFDGFEIFVSFEDVGTPVMENGLAGVWVGLRDNPMPAG